MSSQLSPLEETIAEALARALVREITEEGKGPVNSAGKAADEALHIDVGTRVTVADVIDRNATPC